MKRAEITVEEDRLGKSTHLVASTKDCRERLILGSWYWTVVGQQGAWQAAHKARGVITGMNTRTEEHA